MFQKIKSFLSKGNRAQWCVFLWVLACVFIKCMLFQWSCFHSLSPRDVSLMTFSLNKLIVALFISSFIFAFKRKIGIIIGLIIIDIWCVANIFYYRANGLFLNFEAIEMATNLAGFEDSLTTLIDANVIIYILFSFVTLVSFLFIEPYSRHKKNLKDFLLAMLSVYILMLISHLPNWLIDYESCKDTRLIREEKMIKLVYHNTKRLVVPFYNVMHYAKFSENNWESNYVNDYSGAHYLLALGIYDMAQHYYKPIIELNSSEKELVHSLIRENITSTKDYQSNLVIIFVESLESWALDMCDAEGNLLLPNLAGCTSHADLYCDKIKSQVKNGVSGDGQLIVNTGLLPINQGAACLLYPHNVYPNFSHIFKHSAIINPWPKVWGQDIVTYSYGYHQLIEPIKGDGEQDIWVLQTLTDYTDSVSMGNYCAFAITISSHMPFNKVTNKNLKFPITMPETMQKYLTCLHYTDSCLGLFINQVIAEKLLKTTTIITGDHTVFKEHMLNEFYPYAKENNLPITSNRNYVPLIVYSPQIKEKTIIEDECYQMDIYPTIMHLIGCEDYYWKGFGVNLLDSIARHNRPITEQEAYELSDKLIRSNYFANIDK